MYENCAISYSKKHKVIRVYVSAEFRKKNENYRFAFKAGADCIIMIRIEKDKAVRYGNYSISEYTEGTGFISGSVSISFFDDNVARAMTTMEEVEDGWKIHRPSVLTTYNSRVRQKSVIPEIVPPKQTELNDLKLAIEQINRLRTNDVEFYIENGNLRARVLTYVEI